MKIPKILLASVPLLLGAGSSIAATSQQIQWMEKGKESVRAKLRDPSSAQFRNVFFNDNRDGIPFACGQVNSANGFGGMTGFQRFVSAGSPSRTWLEEEVVDFHNVWTRACEP